MPSWVGEWTPFIAAVAGLTTGVGGLVTAIGSLWWSKKVVEAKDAQLAEKDTQLV